MRVHLIGIGGIGLSGLARFLKFQKQEVKGSDLYDTPLTRRLKEEGIRVLIPQKRENINGNEDLSYLFCCDKTRIMRSC